MQSGFLLIAASGLFQSPALPVTPDTTVGSAAVYTAAHRPIPGEPLGLTAFYADSAQGQRPMARQYSKAYYTRLAIHHWASFATIPLFGAEYYLGQRLFNDSTNARGGTRSAHSAVALGIAGLFTVNTVTGAWNLWAARKEPAGRLRRYVHAVLMMASDAGFVWTGASAPEGESRRFGGGNDDRSRHRTIAIASMGTALAGYLMMLVWK